jgi:hypothetical protein
MTGSSLKRGTVGLFGVVAALVLGFFVVVFGGVTCREDVGSSDQAPNLCASAGSDVGLFLPPAVGVSAILLLLAAGARTRTLAVATIAIVIVEGGLVAMWALVSHGTIHY